MSTDYTKIYREYSIIKENGFNLTLGDESLYKDTLSFLVRYYKMSFMVLGEGRMAFISVENMDKFENDIKNKLSV